MKVVSNIIFSDEEDAEEEDSSPLEVALERCSSRIQKDDEIKELILNAMRPQPKLGEAKVPSKSNISDDDGIVAITRDTAHPSAASQGTQRPEKHTSFRLGTSPTSVTPIGSSDDGACQESGNQNESVACTPGVDADNFWTGSKVGVNGDEVNLIELAAWRSHQVCLTRSDTAQTALVSTVSSQSFSPSSPFGYNSAGQPNTKEMRDDVAPPGAYQGGSGRYERLDPSTAQFQVATSANNWGEAANSDDSGLQAPFESGAVSKGPTHGKAQATFGLGRAILLSLPALLLVVIIVLPVGFMLTRGGQNGAEDVDGSPYYSDPPALVYNSSSQVNVTTMPTLILDPSKLVLFSNSTAEAIMKNPSSAQGLAYQWLLHDAHANLSPWRLVQRFALATLYYSAGGPNWWDAVSWLDTNLHECNWMSADQERPLCKLFQSELSDVEDNEESSVTALFLRNADLHGTLPTEFFLLTSLEELVLGGNTLQGTIPSEIGQLTNLIELSMDDNKFSGSIPTELGLLTDLRFLFLGDNQLTGPYPDYIKRFEYLIEVNFVGTNSLTGVIDDTLCDILLPIEGSIKCNYGGICGCGCPCT